MCGGAREQMWRRLRIERRVTIEHKRELYIRRTPCILCGGRKRFQFCVFFFYFFIIWANMFSSLAFLFVCFSFRFSFFFLCSVILVAPLCIRLQIFEFFSVSVAQFSIANSVALAIHCFDCGYFDIGTLCVCRSGSYLLARNWIVINRTNTAQQTAATTIIIVINGNNSNSLDERTRSHTHKQPQTVLFAACHIHAFGKYSVA